MNRGKWFLPLFALAVGSLVLASPQAAAQGFTDGLRLCGSSVLPALFPFFVVCELLTAGSSGCWLGVPLAPLAKFLGLRSKSAPLALLVSVVGGYAVCAQVTGRLRRAGQLEEGEAILLLMIGCCAGPGFVVGCVGGLLLGQTTLGIWLFLLQLAANLLSAACLAPFLPKTNLSLDSYQATCMPSVSFSAAISHAVDSSLSVCGCVVFFKVLCAVMLPFLPDSVLTRPLVSAVLEISAGCAEFAALGGAPALYGCGFCVSILGISVWAQLSLLLEGAVPLRWLAVSRLFHLVFYQFLLRYIIPLLPGAAPVYSSLAPRVIPLRRLPPDAAFLLFLFLCAVLYKLWRNLYNKPYNHSF